MKWYYHIVAIFVFFMVVWIFGGLGLYQIFNNPAIVFAKLGAVIIWWFIIWFVGSFIYGRLKKKPSA